MDAHAQRCPGQSEEQPSCSHPESFSTTATALRQDTVHCRSGAIGMQGGRMGTIRAREGQWRSAVGQRGSARPLHARQRPLRFLARRWSTLSFSSPSLCLPAPWHDASYVHIKYAQVHSNPRRSEANRAWQFEDDILSVDAPTRATIPATRMVVCAEYMYM